MAKRRYTCAHSRMLARRRSSRRIASTVVLGCAVAAIPQAANALSAMGLTGEKTTQQYANEIAAAASRTQMLDGSLPERIGLVASTRHRTCGAPSIDVDAGLDCSLDISIIRNLSGTWIQVRDGEQTAIAAVAP